MFLPNEQLWCFTVTYKSVESSVLRKNASKNRKPFCFLLSEAFLRGHIKLKLIVNLVWKLFHQKDSGLYLERTVVSTCFEVELFHFSASCIQQRSGFQIETHHQGDRRSPLVQCLCFPASPLLNDLYRSGFVTALSDISLAVSKRWWSSACYCAIYFHSSIKTGWISVKFFSGVLKSIARHIFLFILITLSCVFWHFKVFSSEAVGIQKCLTATLPAFCSQLTLISCLLYQKQTTY